jgi:hypothetical protein
MIRRIKEGFRFLGQLTDLERKIVKDKARRLKDEIAALKVDAIKRAG